MGERKKTIWIKTTKSNTEINWGERKVVIRVFFLLKFSNARICVYRLKSVVLKRGSLKKKRNFLQLTFLDAWKIHQCFFHCWKKFGTFIRRNSLFSIVVVIYKKKKKSLKQGNPFTTKYSETSKFTLGFFSHLKKWKEIKIEGETFIRENKIFFNFSMLSKVWWKVYRNIKICSQVLLKFIRLLFHGKGKIFHERKNVKNTQ